MTVHDFQVRAIDGTEHSLKEYADKVLLIVNVASRCGFTPQYAGLEKLHQDLQAQGFAVLGFPCNQFGAQEPGSEVEIQQFCTLNYAVSFPLFAKIEVNGADAHPLYRYLKGEKPGVLGTEAIKWNFTKFLVNRNGEVVKRYAPTDKPGDIAQEISALLN